MAVSKPVVGAVEPTVIAMDIDSCNGGNGRDNPRPFRVKQLLQELQHALRAGVGLRQHRDTGLLQDVGAGHVRSLGCEVGILDLRSEEHTSELHSLMRISYAVFCLKKKTSTYIRLLAR